MFKFCLLSLLFIASSAQAMDEQLLAWDDRELGTGLRVSAKGIDQQSRPWTVREAQLKDTHFIKIYSVTLKLSKQWEMEVLNFQKK